MTEPSIVDNLIAISAISTVFTGLASVVAAIGSAFAAVVSARNAKKLEEVHQATNGMKAELVKSTGERMFAKGVLQGEDNPRVRSKQKIEQKVVRKQKKNGRSPNRN